MRKTRTFFIGLTLVVLSVGAGAQERVLDVPYVPTDPQVVAAMLQMAGVGKDDLLYDLGCGDGRIVITAAMLYGTRGVGIDLNPERIKESVENAAKAGVTGLVKFINGDLFQADFHEATVVTLYLLTSVNLRLRPKLFEELRPGSRVVSHDFGMDAWEPDKSETVTVNGYSHSVHFWVIPANVSGVWGWMSAEGARSAPYRLDISQRFQKIMASLKAGDERLAVKEATINGDRIRIVAERQEARKTQSLVFEGRVVRNTIEGSVTESGARPGASRPWRANRDVASITSIDQAAAAR
jgi:SAM-dependent methyltransferase